MDPRERYLRDLAERNRMSGGDLARLARGVRAGAPESELGEHTPLVVEGSFRDIIVPVNGEPVRETEWSANLVVSAFAILLTALCKPNRIPAYTGITHMALGQGNASWDSGGFPAPAATDVTLVSELARKPVTVEDINASNQVVVTGPTGRLLMSAVFNPNEAIGDIREFGLFGGKANDGFTLDQPNQGIMVNHINHAKIVKSLASDFTFTRQVRLIF